MTTSSVSSTTTPAAQVAPTVKLGNSQDVSSMTQGTVSLSVAEAVTSKVQPYLDQATAVQTEISTNSAKVAAYQNMQTLLQSLQTAAANLSSQPTQGSNSFGDRIANISSNSATAASSLMTASVQANTPTGSHQVTINQVAVAEVDASATQSVSASSQLNLSGTFTINETGKTTTAVTVTANMSLNDIASSINGNSTKTGVSASVVSVDSSHAVLVLTGADTNKPLQFSDPNSVLGSLGILSSTTSQTGTVNQADPTAAMNLAGNFTINGGTDSGGNAAPVTVALTADMSMNDIAAAITSASSAAGSSVTASVTNVGGTNQLQITSGNGAAMTLSGVTGNAVSGLGLSASSATNQITAAAPALLTVDGIANIARDTNQISDVLSGVTLNLLQADPNTKMTVGVAADTQSVGNAIQNFVTAYNSWETFVTQNEATDSSGSASSSATLFGDPTLRDASLQVDTTLTGLFNGNSLQGLGVTLDNSNQLQINATTLSTQLTNNFSGVQSLFDAPLTTSSQNLQSYPDNFSTYSGNFTLTIGTDGSGNVNSVTMNGTDTTSFTFSGNSIIGASGTPFQGMAFTYSGTGETVSVNASQGIAGGLYQISDKFANANSGSLQNLVSSIQLQDTNLTTQYNTIVNNANDYTNYLLQQYGTMQSQINQAGQTTNVLQQLMAAQYSSNG